MWVSSPSETLYLRKNRQEQRPGESHKHVLTGRRPEISAEVLASLRTEMPAVNFFNCCLNIATLLPRILTLGILLTFSTSVMGFCPFYLTAKEDYPYPLPNWRIFVRPVFAKTGATSRLLQVNVQLSRTNR